MKNSCPKCGSQILANDLYCEKCGQNLKNYLSRSEKISTAETSDKKWLSALFIAPIALLPFLLLFFVTGSPLDSGLLFYFIGIVVFYIMFALGYF